MDSEEYFYDELPEDVLPMEFYHPSVKYDDSGMVLSSDIDNRYVLLESEEKFHIGQANHKAKKMKCNYCGNDKFEIGQEIYYTSIRCPNCEWERCIHEG